MDFLFVHCWRIKHPFSDTELQKLGSDRRTYQAMNFATTTSQSPQEVFRLVTFELHEIMKKISIRTTNYDSPKITLDMSMPNNDSIVTWNTKYKELFGRCYSMELSNLVTKMGIIQMTFKAKMGIYIYIHYPGQFNDFDSKTKVQRVSFNLGKALICSK